eukprot:SAG11_NODE_7325_length_1160_cov_1.356268_1_plen_128_part_10
MNVRWLFELDGQLHNLEITHSDLTGRKTVKLDGNITLDTGAVLIERGLQHRFTVGDHIGVVRVHDKTFHFEYTCEIDGQIVAAIPTSQRSTLLAETNRVLSEALGSTVPAVTGGARVRGLAMRTARNL